MKHFLLITVLCIGSVYILPQGDRHKVLEMRGIRLTIPDHYLKKGKNYWWIEQTKGLDTNEHNFQFQIPLDELAHLIPDIRERISKFSTNLTGVIFVESLEGLPNKKQHKIESVRAMVEQRGKYSQAIFEVEPDTDFYRVYIREDINNMWDVLTKSPEIIVQNKINENDHFASCSEQPLLNDYTCIVVFSKDQFVFQLTSLPGKLMPEVLVIRDYIFRLIDEWQGQ